jgi:hypothetical protein
MPSRLQLGRAVKRADMKMRFGWQACAFAGQCRSAPSAKPAASSSRRRIELCYLAFGNSVSRMFECEKNRSWCAAMPAATFTMAPIDSFGLTGRNEMDRAAQAAAFELAGRAAHDFNPPFLLEEAVCHSKTSVERRRYAHEFRETWCRREDLLGTGKHGPTSWDISRGAEGTNH